jgi:histidinol-phosphate aminotransferase
MLRFSAGSGTGALETVMSVPPTLRRLVRDSVEQLRPYEPVEAAEHLAARLGMPVEQIVKLDSNENPYGCSLRVQEALASFDRFHFYPDAQATVVRERVAAYAGTTPERIIVGSGADELIDLLLLTVLDPGDEVIVPAPTFGVYRARVELHGGRAVLVPRDAAFDLDMDALLAAINGRTKMIFVTSPNNPTGNLATNQQIVRLLQSNMLVALDEAYFEFSGKTALPLAGEFDNLVILRTFSKWAGLAGLRFGYGIFPSFLADQVWKVKQPFNVNAAALCAVEASLDDLEYLHSTISRIRSERTRLMRQLGRIDYLEPYPSQANFILCRVTRGDAHDVHTRLADRGIMVREYGDPQLRDCLRISVGRPEESERLVSALQNIGAHV